MDNDGARLFQSLIGQMPYVTRFTNPTTGASWPVPENARTTIPAPPPPVAAPILPVFDTSGWIPGGLGSNFILTMATDAISRSWFVACHLNTAKGKTVIEVNPQFGKMGDGYLFELSGVDAYNQDGGGHDTDTFAAWNIGAPYNSQSNYTLGSLPGEGNGMVFAFDIASPSSYPAPAIISADGWKILNHSGLVVGNSLSSIVEGVPGPITHGLPNGDPPIVGQGHQETNFNLTGHSGGIKVLQSFPLSGPGLIYLQQATTLGSCLVLIYGETHGVAQGTPTTTLGLA